MNKEKLTFELDNLLRDKKLPHFHLIVKKDHEELFNYGFSNDVKDVNNVIFPFYSMSKLITSVTLLQLVDENKISLKDKVSKYLPSFANCYYFDENKNKIITDEITIEDCLSMRAGLDYNLKQEEVIKLCKNNPNASTYEVCSIFPKYPLCFKPKTDFNYSLSIDVAAAIIEMIEGKSFSHVVKQRIFSPLKMNSSTFENYLDKIDNLLPEYVYQDNKIIKQDYWYKDFLFSKKYECGGAGLISTVNDYSIFVDLLAMKSNKLLSNDSYKELIRCRTDIISISQDYPNKSPDYGYGLAVRVRTKVNNYFPVNEFGWDGACGCFSLIDQENHLSIVIGMNLANWPDYFHDTHLIISELVYKYLLDK